MISLTSEGTPRYVLAVVFVLAVAVGGFAGFLIYPGLDRPSTVGVSLLALSVAAGIASLFSPCSFPLLVTLLAREIGQTETGRTRRAVSFAAALALGATTFLVFVGGGLAAGLGRVFQEITFASAAGVALRIVVGGLLVILGLVQLGRIGIPFGAVAATVRPVQERQAALRRQHPVAGFGVLGFIYILAGFG